MPDAEPDPRAPDPAAAPGYQLEELAEASGVPARTIRFYRQSGLIEAPERRGRRAYYAPDQLRRLRLIADLRERGLGLDAITKILADPGREQESLAAVLRAGDEFRKPWIDDRDAILTPLEVLEMAGTHHPDALDLLQRYGMIAKVARADADLYQVPSVATLELAGDLNTAGISPELAQEAWDAMQLHLGRLAGDLVALFAQATASELPFDDLLAAFNDLRGIALRAVQVAFGHQIEETLAQFVAAGGVLEMTGHDTGAEAGADTEDDRGDPDG